MSAYPASTAARDAPTAAPKASASGYNVDSNVSAFFSARPPETTRLAAPELRTILDFVSEVLTCSDGELETSTGSSDLASTSRASGSDGAAAENAVDLTVKNLIGIDEDALTVAMAFPAYMGRVNVVLLDDESCSREVMSDTAGMSNLAATRGRIDFADEEWADTTCVKGEFSDRSFSKSGERVSAIGIAYCADVECRIEVRPFSLPNHILISVSSLPSITYYAIR